MKLKFYLLLLLLFSLVLYTCQQSSIHVPDPQNGKALANAQCASCHALPKPDELPRATWEQYILPRMGYLMGIYEFPGQRDTLIENGPGGDLVQAANIFPEKAQIKEEDWLDIQAYYLRNAPEILNMPIPSPIQTDLSLFTPKRSEMRLSPPSTTMVKVGANGGFFIGDANSQGFYQFAPNQKFLNLAKVTEGAVHVDEFPSNFLITIMGSFSPTDEPKGILLALPKDRKNQPSILINKLQRPVHTAVADLDKDQNPDFIISEFAKWTGKLAHWKLVNGKYEPTILRKQPGAIRSIVTDLDKDGNNDIVALFGQGAEGIYAFFNKGEEGFEEKLLLEFPATYGSSFFDLRDIDRDGDFDIVYTNGDNADYSPVLKPYHGIRFFTNDGENNFTESFFYPYPGAYKAIPADFDGDGDYDIAAISFFPGYQFNTAPSFVYLENVGNGGYVPKTFTDVNQGRWITMDAGDIDLDGDLDIILGSLAFEVVPNMGLLDKWVEAGIPFIVLENQIVQSNLDTE